MTCPKCHGLLIAGDEPDERKCANCGKVVLGIKAVRASVREAALAPPRVGAKSPVLSAAVKAKISGSWTAERREKFQATMAARRRERGGRPATAKHVTSVDRLIPSNEPVALRTNGDASWSEWKANLLRELADAEQKLAMKLEGLRQAKERIAEL